MRFLVLIKHGENRRIRGGFTVRKGTPEGVSFFYIRICEHACDLFAEIILFLLKTLAALIAPESRKSDLAAEFLRGVLYILTDGHGIVLNGKPAR